MARAYAGLKNTAEAVDAACGAIVSWGPTHENRAEALEALKQVLRDAPDLDAYVGRVGQAGGGDRAWKTRSSARPWAWSMPNEEAVRQGDRPIEAGLRSAAQRRRNPPGTWSPATTSRATSKGPCGNCWPRCNSRGATSQLYEDLGQRLRRAEPAGGSRTGLHVDRRDAAQRIGEPRRCWPRSASSRTAGTRRSSTGSRSRESGRWSRPAC